MSTNTWYLIGIVAIIGGIYWYETTQSSNGTQAPTAPAPSAQPTLKSVAAGIVQNAAANGLNDAIASLQLSGQSCPCSSDQG